MRLDIHNTAGLNRVLMALTVIAGEWTGFSNRIIASIWPILAVAGATFCLAAWGWRLRGWCLPALFGLGFILALRTDNHLHRMLSSNKSDFGTRAPFLLTVESTACRWHTSKQGQWRTSFDSHIDNIPVRVIMATTAISDLPQIGEVWSCKGWLSEKEIKNNRYARRTLWISKAIHSKRLSKSDLFTAKAIYAKLRNNLASRLTAGLDWCPELAKLNCAILLGQRNGLSREKRQIFADAGTIHVFAISGLHVMVVALLLRSIMTRLCFTGASQSLVVIPLLWSYTILTGMRPSAVRAALMATFWLSAPILGRRPDSLSAWATTALLVYGLHPEMVFDIGSTLSFTVMFGIVLWVEWTQNFHPVFRDSPWAERFPRIFGEHGKANRLLSFCGVSLAAWIAGVPIAASVFGRFTPGGLLANLAVLYCADKMVKVGISGLLISFLCLPLAALFNNLAASFTWAMTELSQLVAALPFSTYTISSWTLSSTLFWYGSWLSAFLFIGHFLPVKSTISRKWWT